MKLGLLLSYKLLFCILTLSFFSSSNLTAQDDSPSKLKEHSYPEIDSFISLYQNARIFQKVIPYATVARDKALKDFGSQDSIFAEYTRILGASYNKQGQYKKALPLLIQAKDIIEEVLGTNNSDFAIALGDLASLYYAMGNYKLALPLFVQGAKIDEKTLGENHPDFAISLNNLAIVYQEVGDYNSALPLLIRAKNIKEKTIGTEHPSFAVSLLTVALVYQKMGNFDLALPLLLQCKTTLENKLRPNHPYLGIMYSNLANLYQEMGKYKIALPLLIKALAIDEQAKGKNHPEIIFSLNNLSAVYQRLENYDLALPIQIRAIEIGKKTLGTEHFAYSESLNSLAHLHFKMGNPNLAIPIQIEACAIREKTLGANHPELALALSNLAELYRQTGKYELAWLTLQKTFKVSSGLNISYSISSSWADSLRNANYASSEHIDRLAGSLKIVYDLLNDQKISPNQKKQIIIADLATFLIEKLQNEYSSEGDKLRMLSKSNAWLLQSLSILDKKEHSLKAFELTDQNKSVLLLQATKSEEVYQLGNLPDSLIEKDRKLLQKKKKLEARLVEKRSKEEKDSLRIILNNVNQDIQGFKSVVEQQYPEYAKFKYQKIDANAKNIQNLLNEKTALLEYVIGDSSVHIFYVDRTNVIWSETPISNKILTDNIKKFHGVLSNYSLLSKNSKESYQKYTQLASWFYKNLVAPVLTNTDNISNLIIVTDGELGHLPFETFLLEDPSQKQTEYSKLKYLVNKYNISYNYSATLWKENTESPPPNNNGQILAMAANYETKLDSNRIANRLHTDLWLREKLNPLPAARKEVKALEEEFYGFFAFDNEASEKNIKEKASDYAIIHLAMHGLLNNKKPILSSLAFTEDSDSLESNFWQAHEISKLKLNANLVVLSACETGYGKFERGNGIASLARAFMYAGASSLVVSLWQVNDQATSKIMQILYRNLANGMNKDEALRYAKLEYIKSAKGILMHPAFWSPFIQIGNVEPVSISRKGKNRPWLIGGGIILLVGMIVLFYQKSKSLKEA